MANDAPRSIRASTRPNTGETTRSPADEWIFNIMNYYLILNWMIYCNRGQIYIQSKNRCNPKKGKRKRNCLPNHGIMNNSSSCRAFYFCGRSIGQLWWILWGPMLLRRIHQPLQCLGIDWPLGWDMKLRLGTVYRWRSCSFLFACSLQKCCGKMWENYSHIKLLMVLVLVNVLYWGFWSSSLSDLTVGDEIIPSIVGWCSVRRLSAPVMVFPARNGSWIVTSSVPKPFKTHS